MNKTDIARFRLECLRLAIEQSESSADRAPSAADDVARASAYAAFVIGAEAEIGADD